MKLLRLLQISGITATFAVEVLFNVLDFMLAIVLM